MGFFSWKTSDTKENIMNCHTNQCRSVYLLQPDGRENILETAYDGYGEFGGMDAHAWLAENNIDIDLLLKADALDIEHRTLGIYIDYNYYVDTRTGLSYCYVLNNLFPDLLPFNNYQEMIDGKTPNELIKEGIWIPFSLTDYFGEIEYPLKFSFDKDAVYEKVEPAEDSDNQGFFF